MMKRSAIARGCRWDTWEANAGVRFASEESTQPAPPPEPERDPRFAPIERAETRKAKGARA
jgi:hypothetical protein